MENLHVDLFAVLNGLDLFTGIAGITVALSDWVEPITYCERNLYCISVLLERMRSGEIPIAPICTDVRELRGSDFRDTDIIYGGFPCQDISVAGNGVGLEGERSGLFYEVVRLAKETRTPFVFLENVPAIRTRGLREVIRAFTNLGYECRWTRISAQEVGAPHLRERWFMLAANTDSIDIRIKSGWSKWESGQGETKPGDNGKKESLADTVIEILEGSSRQLWESRYSKLSGDAWKEVEPTVCRSTNDVPFRVYRIKSIGNAVVPLQAKVAFERLMGIKHKAGLIQEMVKNNHITNIKNKRKGN
jgi:DNA (cytosine-5)-methyltransferase 1